MKSTTNRRRNRLAPRMVLAIIALLAVTVGPPTIPEAEAHEPAPTLSCPAGFTGPIGNQCTRTVRTPAPATCTVGYTLSGSTCERVLTHAPICATGFTLTGTTCLSAPACPTGYSGPSGGQCTRTVTVPATPSCNSGGSLETGTGTPLCIERFAATSTCQVGVPLFGSCLQVTSPNPLGHCPTAAWTLNEAGTQCARFVDPVLSCPGDAVVAVGGGCARFHTVSFSCSSGAPSGGMCQQTETIVPTIRSATPRCNAGYTLVSQIVSSVCSRTLSQTPTYQCDSGRLEGTECVVTTQVNAITGCPDSPVNHVNDRGVCVHGDDPSINFPAGTTGSSPFGSPVAAAFSVTPTTTSVGVSGTGCSYAALDLGAGPIAGSYVLTVTSPANVPGSRTCTVTAGSATPVTFTATFRATITIAETGRSVLGTDYTGSFTVSPISITPRTTGTGCSVSTIPGGFVPGAYVLTITSPTAVGERSCTVTAGNATPATVTASFWQITFDSTDRTGTVGTSFTLDFDLRPIGFTPTVSGPGCSTATTAGGFEPGAYVLTVTSPTTAGERECVLSVAGSDSGVTVTVAFGDSDAAISGLLGVGYAVVGATYVDDFSYSGTETLSLLGDNPAGCSLTNRGGGIWRISITSATAQAVSCIFGEPIGDVTEGTGIIFIDRPRVFADTTPAPPYTATTTEPLVLGWWAVGGTAIDVSGVGCMNNVEIESNTYRRSILTHSSSNPGERTCVLTMTTSTGSTVLNIRTTFTGASQDYLRGLAATAEWFNGEPYRDEFEAMPAPTVTGTGCTRTALGGDRYRLIVAALDDGTRRCTVTVGELDPVTVSVAFAARPARITGLNANPARQNIGTTYRDVFNMEPETVTPTVSGHSSCTLVQQSARQWRLEASSAVEAQVECTVSAEGAESVKVEIHFTSGDYLLGIDTAPETQQVGTDYGDPFRTNLNVSVRGAGECSVREDGVEDWTLLIDSPATATEDLTCVVFPTTSTDVQPVTIVVDFEQPETTITVETGARLAALGTDYTTTFRLDPITTSPTVAGTGCSHTFTPGGFEPGAYTLTIDSPTAVGERSCTISADGADDVTVTARFWQATFATPTGQSPVDVSYSALFTIAPTDIIPRSLTDGCIVTRPGSLDGVPTGGNNWKLNVVALTEAGTRSCSITVTGSLGSQTFTVSFYQVSGLDLEATALAGTLYHDEFTVTGNTARTSSAGCTITTLMTISAVRLTEYRLSVFSATAQDVECLVRVGAAEITVTVSFINARFDGLARRAYANIGGEDYRDDFDMVPVDVLVTVAGDGCMLVHRFSMAGAVPGAWTLAVTGPDEPGARECLLSAAGVTVTVVVTFSVEWSWGHAIGRVAGCLSTSETDGDTLDAIQDAADNPDDSDRAVLGRDWWGLIRNLPGIVVTVAGGSLTAVGSAITEALGTWFTWGVTSFGCVLWRFWIPDADGMAGLMLRGHNCDFEIDDDADDAATVINCTQVSLLTWWTPIFASERPPCAGPMVPVGDWLSPLANIEIDGDPNTASGNTVIGAGDLDLLNDRYLSTCDDKLLGQGARLVRGPMSGLLLLMCAALFWIYSRAIPLIIEGSSHP